MTTSTERKAVDDMTAKELRDELRERGLPLDGAKTALNDRVNEARAGDVIDAEVVELDEDGDAGTALAVMHDAEVERLEARAEMVRQQIVCYTPEQKQLVKRTLMDDKTTDDELALFLTYAQRIGLDPIARQIHAVRRKGKLAFQTSIDGFRLIAKRTGKFGGRLGPWWCGQDGEWKDVWLSEAAPLAAKAEILNTDAPHPVTGTALWKEFYPGDGDGGFMWRKMPTVMLAKCAEAQALRAAFPAELSGVYADEEMEQANEQPRRSPVEYRQEQAGKDSGAPKTRAELLQRFAQVFGDGRDERCRDTAAEFIKEALQVEYDVDALSELGGRAGVAFIKLVSAVMHLEDTTPDLGLATGVRQTVAQAFAAKLPSGPALHGPPWRLGPDEEGLPDYWVVTGKTAPVGGPVSVSEAGAGHLGQEGAGSREQPAGAGAQGVSGDYPAWADDLDADMPGGKASGGGGEAA